MVSRQREQQKQNVAAGMCMFHKYRQAASSKGLCEECYRKNIEKQRKKLKRGPYGSKILGEPRYRYEKS